MHELEFLAIAAEKPEKDLGFEGTQTCASQILLGATINWTTKPLAMVENQNFTIKKTTSLWNEDAE